MIIFSNSYIIQENYMIFKGYFYIEEMLYCSGSFEENK